MIRFLLVLLAFVSALLAFIFQETALFVASGFLLMVSVVMLLLHVREQVKRKNRLRLPTELTPEDELKARGVLDVRPKVKSSDVADSEYAPTENVRGSGATEAELLALGILEVRAKPASQKTLFSESGDSTEEPLPLDEPDSVAEAPVSESMQEAEQEKDPKPVVKGKKTVPSRRRRVEVDAHLPVLQASLGAHTVCLIDVDTDFYVYRLRAVVSEGAVDNAGTEYPFAGFFLSDLLAETSVIDMGEGGLDAQTMGVMRADDVLAQLVAAPVMRNGLPAAFFVAVFRTEVDESCVEAVASAAEFFSSLYVLQGDEPAIADSPLASAMRKPPPLRLVKSNPRAAQRRIIREEMDRARDTSSPLALALVCLDGGDQIEEFDESVIHEVEAWMRDCLEAVTPDGRVEYFGRLGYGILQARDVTDVEGWVRRAQIAFSRQNGPVNAHPIVGVAMLSDQHTDPDQFQADAFRALRAAYECGDSTILVG